jgi:hypothetical protein
MRVANDPLVRPVDSDRVGDLISYWKDRKSSAAIVGKVERA